MSQDLEVSAYSGGPTELDTMAESYIKEFAKEFNATEVETAPVDSAAPPTEQENSVAAPETPPVVEAKPEERGLERLVEREVALRTREQEISTKESRLAALEAEIQALKGRSLSDDLLQKAEYAPEEVLKALGLDPEMVVRQVIANRLGPDAPPEIKQTVESAQIKKQLNELKRELAEHQQRAQAAQFVAQVEAGARQYVEKGLSENVPTVAAVAKANPMKVYREILEEIAQDANVKTARGLGGDVLTYDEAAKRVEARWSEFKTYFAPPAPSTPTPASTPVSQTTSTGAPKPNPPATKPPDRPIAPWLQRGEIEDEGIKAAVAEYNRLESQRGR